MKYDVITEAIYCAYRYNRGRGISHNALMKVLSVPPGYDYYFFTRYDKEEVHGPRFPDGSMTAPEGWPNGCEFSSETVKAINASEARFNEKKGRSGVVWSGD